MTQPTPYAEVNAILDQLLIEVRAILGRHFVGLYLYGSLASGDFNPYTSDIDFLAVAAGDLPAETISALAAMHERLAAGPSKWGAELEGSYIPLPALRRYDPNNARHPRIERGGRLRVEQHENESVIQRHIARERGIVLAGPPPQTLIEPISPDELRRAVLALLRGWWGPMLNDDSRLRHSGYQVYAVLTMCRMLYTLQQGTIVSKSAAGRWAQATLSERWMPLIEQALAWQNDMPFDHLNETLDFIQFTVESSRP